MESLLQWIARIAGLAGAAFFVVAVAVRAVGLYWIGGVQAGTVLFLGAATMALACLCYLALLVEFRRR
jgi:hypothetical protein